MTSENPTFLGTISLVAGPSITVRLAKSLASGLAIIGGSTYRVGQVGSFVRVPQGYQDLYGVVSEVGAGAIPVGVEAENVDGGKWMRVELVGESIGEYFERGLGQLPNINDAVHIVTEADLRRIYGQSSDDQVVIGSLSSAENIECRLSLDALVTRHSAILGSTGSGKSTTVASLLRSIICADGAKKGSSGARILLLDIHGEYKSALADLAAVYSATPLPGEKPLFVPYWALDANELLDFVVGTVNEGQQIAFTDRILAKKAEYLAANKLPGIDLQSLTVDSPVPFSLKQLWYELIDFEMTTYTGKDRNVPALEAKGDAAKLVPPKYTPHAMGSVGPFLNSAAKGIRRQLDFVRSRLVDRRYDFILHPGPWEPDLGGNVSCDLDKLLLDWLGHDKPLTILDLSGVPSAALERLVGSILRISYEALFWSREKSEGGVQRPLLIVMEEAHRYLAPGSDSAATEIAKRIAKEGRKYGVGAMLVSQRPTEVDETILSQCGTILALRLSNPEDRGRVKGTLPDNLAGLMDLLPVLRTGEAIVVGEAARLPVRCRVTLPSPEHRPNSTDPKVSEAWATRRKFEGYDRVVASWRAQQPTAVVNNVKVKRNPVSDGPAGEG